MWLTSRVRLPLRACTCRRRSAQRSFTSPATAAAAAAPIRPYRPRRALMYVPGSSTKMLAKSSTLPVDSLCLDLEDSVAVNQKSQARTNIAQTLQSFPIDRAQRKSEVLVRINPLSSGLEFDDIDAVLSLTPQSHWPDGFVIPKVESRDHVLTVIERIRHHAQKTSSAANHSPLSIIALIESGRALINLPSIASASPQLQAFIFGGDDYAADIGAVRSQDSDELLYARQFVVSVAKAHRLQAIDIVHIDYRDLDQLARECQRGFQFGFTGKQCIHPTQIPIIQANFAPSRARVEWANRVVAASEQHAAAGVGAFSVDGQMIDLPTIKAAQQVIELAKACGVEL